MIHHLWALAYSLKLLYQSPWVINHIPFEIVQTSGLTSNDVAFESVFPYHRRKPMRRKRTAQLLTTAQVARILGVATKTLYRMLQDGRIPEPQRDPDNNYRIWIPQQIEAIREEMAR